MHSTINYRILTINHIGFYILYTSKDKYLINISVYFHLEI